MKISVFAVLLLVAGAFALPQIEEKQRVKDGIERISALIKRLGYDPLEIIRAENLYERLPGIFEVKLLAENVVLTGPSNIAVDYDVDYNVFLRRLRFKLSLPELLLVIGNSRVEIKLLENVDIISLSGSLAVRGVTLAGEIGFNTSWQDGITVRSITLDLSYGRTEADLIFIAFKRDRSESLNSLLGERIPSFLEDNRNEINRALEVIVRHILNIFL